MTSKSDNFPSLRLRVAALSGSLGLAVICVVLQGGIDHNWARAGRSFSDRHPRRSSNLILPD